MLQCHSLKRTATTVLAKQLCSQISESAMLYTCRESFLIGFAIYNIGYTSNKTKPPKFINGQQPAEKFAKQKFHFITSY